MSHTEEPFESYSQPKLVSAFASTMSDIERDRSEGLQEILKLSAEGKLDSVMNTLGRSRNINAGGNLALDTLSIIVNDLVKGRVDRNILAGFRIVTYHRDDGSKVISFSIPKLTHSGFFRDELSTLMDGEIDPNHEAYFIFSRNGDIRRQMALPPEQLSTLRANAAISRGERASGLTLGNTTSAVSLGLTAYSNIFAWQNRAGHVLTSELSMETYAQSAKHKATSYLSEMIQVMGITISVDTASVVDKVVSNIRRFLKNSSFDYASISQITSDNSIRRMLFEALGGTYVDYKVTPTNNILDLFYSRTNTPVEVSLGVYNGKLCFALITSSTQYVNPNSERQFIKKSDIIRVLLMQHGAFGYSYNIHGTNLSGEDLENVLRQAMDSGKLLSYANTDIPINMANNSRGGTYGHTRSYSSGRQGTNRAYGGNNGSSSQERYGSMGKSETRQQDYYSILGVPRNATTDEVKKAFRRLARQYHPDVNKDKGAEAMFKRINEAYEVLEDPTKRAAYDRGI